MFLSELKFAYENRYAAVADAKRAGQKVIGYVGAAFPRELVLAAGALPIAVTPHGARPTPTANHYIEPIVASDIRDLFEAGVTGEWADIDLLVVTRPYAKLYYYLKEIYRQGRAPKLPVLHMFDLMQSQRDAVVTYNEGRFRDLIEAIARVTGQQPQSDEIAQALALTTRIRKTQQRLLDLRWQGALPGVDALIALGAGFFATPAQYESMLAAFVTSLKPNTLNNTPRWLVATAEPLSHVNLHRVLEDAGGVVIAEDDAWGSRAVQDDASPELAPLQALETLYMNAATGHVWPEQARETWFEKHVVRPEVDGVVFYVPPSDRQFGWDYPRLKQLTEQAGKPTLLIRQDAHSAEGREQIRAAAAEFCAACVARASS